MSEGAKKKASWIGWLVVLAAFILNLVPTFSQGALSPLAAEVMETYSLSQAQYVSLFTAPSLAPIFLSFVAGILLDKFGSKYTIFIAALLTTIGTVLRIFAADYALLYLSMVLIGVITSFVLSGCTKIFSQYFPMEKLGLPIGILYAASSLGMLVAMVSATAIGMHMCFIVAAGLAVFATLLWLIIAPKDQEGDAMPPMPGMPEQGAGEPQKFSESLKDVLSCGSLWFVIIAITCLGTLGMAANSMLPTALAERGMSTASAGTVSGMLAAGMLVGSVIVPAVSNKVKNTKAFVAVLCALCAIISPLIMIVPVGAGVGALLFVYGLLQYGAVPLLMSMPIRLAKVGPAKAATAGGLLNMFMSAGITLLPSFVLTPIAGGNSFIFFVICGILCAIAMIATLFVRLPAANAVPDAPMPAE